MAHARLEMTSTDDVVFRRASGGFRAGPFILVEPANSGLASWDENSWGASIRYFDIYNVKVDAGGEAMDSSRYSVC